jgi:hypothetical protein
MFVQDMSMVKLGPNSGDNRFIGQRVQRINDLYTRILRLFM